MVGSTWIRGIVAALVLAATLVVSLSGPGSRSAQAGKLHRPASTPVGPEEPKPQPSVRLLVPDLVTERVSDLDLIYEQETGRRVLRFSNRIANVGDGPIELRGRPALQAARYRVSQRLYGTEGQVLVEPIVDEIVYHRDHGHWHLEDFASYELWKATFDGRILTPVEVRAKISYCLFDHRPGSESAPEQAYGTCEPELQGISPGWTDTYDSDVPDQWVDVSGLDDGVYVLRSVVNPRGVLRERTRKNNEYLLGLRLQGIQFSQVELHPEPWSLLPPHPDEVEG
ncbi:MAG: lysyl oxidase family protein [Anaerolineales bacterium]|nr:lysyl oxidase family protein [Anaerolineales bacterium]